MRCILLILPLVLLLSGCGTGSGVPGEEPVTMIGVTQVLFAGTMSETVVLEVTVTGEYYALVGDMARELIPIYGSEVAITGMFTEEGWSAREELQKILVIDYSVLGEPELP